MRLKTPNRGAATLAVFDHTCIQDSPAITFQALINVNVSHLRQTRPSVNFPSDHSDQSDKNSKYSPDFMVP